MRGEWDASERGKSLLVRGVWSVVHSPWSGLFLPFPRSTHHLLVRQGIRRGITHAVVGEERPEALTPSRQMLVNRFRRNAKRDGCVFVALAVDLHQQKDHPLAIG